MEPINSNRSFAGLYESFAPELFAGSVAGVVITTSPLSGTVMQGVAAELAAPTTGFIALGERPDRRMAARFFTPRQEIDACGYVTVALAIALAELGVWADGSGDYAIVAPGGVYDVSFDDSGAGVLEVRLGVRVHNHEVVADTTAIERLIELEPHPTLSPEIVTTGLRHLVVPVADEASLRALVPEREPIEELGEQLGVDTVSLICPVEGGAVRLRDLCAPIGDLEEPASGTTSGAVADYLSRHGWGTAPRSCRLCRHTSVEAPRTPTGSSQPRCRPAREGRDARAARGRLPLGPSRPMSHFPPTCARASRLRCTRRAWTKAASHACEAPSRMLRVREDGDARA
jgi:trans-2,3-dihydro-3-hydroxyanthranilate isomerase